MRALFLVEDDPEEVFRNVRERGKRTPARGFVSEPDEEVRHFGRSSCAYGRLLAAAATQHRVAVLAPRPWDTLLQRAAAALSVSSEAAQV